MIERLIKVIKIASCAIAYLFAGHVGMLLLVALISPPVSPVLAAITFFAGVGVAGAVHYVINGKGIFSDF